MREETSIFQVSNHVLDTILSILHILFHLIFLTFCEVGIIILILKINKSIVIQNIFIHYSSPLPTGICSKTPSGCLKPHAEPIYLYSVIFLYMYTCDKD